MPNFFRNFFLREKLSFTRARVIILSMKGQITTVFALALCIFAGAAGTNDFSAQAADAQPAADPVTITAETDKTELFLPATYEQYLPLESPSYVAFCNRYIAVADKNILYVYDRNGTQTYHCYTHLTTSENIATNISKVQFTAEGELYFNDQFSDLYRYDIAEGKAVIQDNMGCSTFLIHGEYLYMATTVTTGSQVTFSYVPLSNISYDARISLNDRPLSASNPHMTFADGKLYCVINNNTIIAYDGQTHAYVGSFSGKLDHSQAQIAGLQFVCAYRGALFYSVNSEPNNAVYPNGIYRSDFTGNSVSVLEGNGYSALTEYEGELYGIRGSSVLKLNLSGEDVFSSYEITAASASENRISDAVASARARNLLVTADAGNKRLSVYDCFTEHFSVIPCEDEAGHAYSPALVATDGEIIAAAYGNNVYVYEKKNGAFALSYACRPNNVIAGISCVYGKCYFVTKGFGYGAASADFSQEQVCVRDDVSQEHPPAALTSDLYGNLYVVRTDGKVYKYTESNFTDKAAAPLGEALEITLPADFRSVHADFEGNLYCLSENMLYRNGAPFAAIDASDFVYRKEGTDFTPVSFALGFEDNKIVFQFGDFMIETKALSFPALNQIAAESVREKIFAPAQGAPALVDVAEGAVSVQTDLARFRAEDAAYFPYRSYRRTENVRRGILLAETEQYSLVALFDKNNAFTAELFRNADCTPAPQGEYWAEAEGARYLSGNVHAYYFPCLDDALTDEGFALARAQKVTLLGTVTNDDYPAFRYALVSFETEEGAKQGFVPLTYLTEIPPSAPVGEFRVGYIKAGTSGFFSENGEALTLSERTQAEIAENGNGTYTARIVKDGVVYTARALSSDAIESNVSDAARISTIVILSVLAVIIVGVYVFLLPRKRKI